MFTTHVLMCVAPILMIVNFAFLLFKDALLFPWIYFLWMFLAWLLAIAITFIATIVFIVE